MVLSFVMLQLLTAHGKSCMTTTQAADSPSCWLKLRHRIIVAFTGSKLEVALTANAIKLSKNAAAGLPETWNLVQVELAATNFSSFSAAAAPSMHKFLSQTSKGASYSTSRQQPSAPSKHHDAIHIRSQDVAAESDIFNSSEQAVAPSEEGVVHISGKAQEVPDQLTASAATGAESARQCFDSHGCFQESSGYLGVDIEQQRQMLRDIEARRIMLRQQGSSQLGTKRTRTAQQAKLGVKQSKLEHNNKQGQQTITSLFGKGE